MERILVAFEGPDCTSAEAYEAKWDGWVRSLSSRGLQLVTDLDPVATVGYGTDYIAVYEAVSL